MVEIILSAGVGLLFGLLLGLPLGAFLLVGWVNRYTSRQVESAHSALDKLKDIANAAASVKESKPSGPTRVM